MPWSAVRGSESDRLLPGDQDSNNDGGEGRGRGGRSVAKFSVRTAFGIALTFAAIALLSVVMVVQRRRLDVPAQTDLMYGDHHLKETAETSPENTFRHSTGSDGDTHKTGRGSRGGEPTGSNSNVLENKPNVIFVLIDDVGMNDIGFRSTDMKAMTPFMDTLASQGVVLTNYHTNHICTPSRASIMTGRDTFRTGMQFEAIEASAPWGLPLEEVTIAERFKAAGYATHMTGKWHLGGYTEDHYPFNRGFDSFLGYLGGSEGYAMHRACETATFEHAVLTCFNDFGFGDPEGGYVNHTRNTTRMGPEMVGHYSTDIFNKQTLRVATEHMHANADRAEDDQVPLFMYIAHQAAHYPIQVPPDGAFNDEEREVLSTLTSESISRNKFARVVFYLDKILRDMVEELTEMGMMDNTVLVLASDNGGCYLTGGSNYPYRGIKHTLFEGGTRVPAFVYSTSESLVPFAVRNTSYDGLMHAMDWTQTLAHIAGLPLEEMGKPLDGFNHWPAIVGEHSESLDGAIRPDLVLGRSSYDFDDTDTSSMVKANVSRGAYIKNEWKAIMGERCSSWYSFADEEPFETRNMCDVSAGCQSCTMNCEGDDNNFLFNLIEDPFERGGTVTTPGPAWAVDPTYEILLPRWYRGDWSVQEHNALDLPQDKTIRDNLIDVMPEKFDEMRVLWDAACEGEVLPAYEPEEPEALARWTEFNGWVVAWR